MQEAGGHYWCKGLWYGKLYQSALLMPKLQVLSSHFPFCPQLNTVGIVPPLFIAVAQVLISRLHDFSLSGSLSQLVKMRDYPQLLSACAREKENDL